MLAEPRAQLRLLRAATGKQHVQARVVLVRAEECFGEQIDRSEEHTSELQSQSNLVCRLLLEKKKQTIYIFRLRAPYDIGLTSTHRVVSLRTPGIQLLTRAAPLLDPNDVRHGR